MGRSPLPGVGWWVSLALYPSYEVGMRRWMTGERSSLALIPRGGRGFAGSTLREVRRPPAPSFSSGEAQAGEGVREVSRS